MALQPNFQPPWYLRSGHLQTILTAVRKPKAKLPGTLVHTVPIPPYGATHIYENAPADRDAPDSLAVLMFHGLGSSHGGTYMSMIAKLLVERGLRVIRVDLPGSGPSASLSWLPAHAGCSPQMLQILEWSQENLGIQNWIGIGFSLGGNVLLKTLSDIESDPNSEFRNRFHLAVAVAPPIDLAACCDQMSRYPNRLYADYFLKGLLREVERRKLHWQPWREISPKAPPKTIRDFDNTYTAVLAGFESADDYYAKSSAQSLIPHIQTPTLLLCDRHDPIVPAEIFQPIASTIANNPKHQIQWTTHGGHLGYLHRNDHGRLERWADVWIADRITEAAQGIA